MADQKPKTAPGPKVSPTRTAVSLILLLVVGVISAIEIRSGFGPMMTAKAMAAKSTDGEFNNVSLEEAKGMVSLFPTVVVDTREADTVYKYEWFSLLRPLMGQENPQLVIVASNDEKPVAMAYTTEDLYDQPSPKPPSDGSATPGMGGPGMGGPGMGGPGMGGGGGMRPPMGGPPGGGGGSMRPPMDSDEPAAPATETPAATAPADTAPSDSGSATPAPADTAPAETPAPTEPAPAAESTAPADPAVPAAEESPK